MRRAILLVSAITRIHSGPRKGLNETKRDHQVRGVCADRPKDAGKRGSAPRDLVSP